MNQNFVKQKFKEFYEKKTVVAPNAYREREFGFGDIKKIDYRHVEFKSEVEMHMHFINHAPLYASFSTGYYEFPDRRPMQKKSFQGADLLFEFDADCTHSTLTCYKCLGETKRDSIKLVEDFLMKDFGFKKADISYVFSGNRGYHIYVVNDSVLNLSGKARREIVDYVQAKGIDVNTLLKENPTIESKGWKGKLAKSAYAYVQETNTGKLKDPKFKEHALQQMKEGNYDLFKGSTFWNNIVKREVVNMKADIDQSVTYDLSRLIRMPTTLHGSTGLLCQPVKDMDSYDPFKDSIVFNNPPIEVTFLEDVAELTLNDETFGPFKKDSTQNVPEYLAVFLAGRKVVRVK